MGFSSSSDKPVSWQLNRVLRKRGLLGHRLQTGTVFLLPHSVGHSKSQGLPRVKELGNTPSLDERTYKVTLQRVWIQGGEEN